MFRREHRMEPVSGVVYYCKDCEKIVTTRQIGRKYVYSCDICRTKNVAFGTEKSIRSYFHYDDPIEVKGAVKPPVAGGAPTAGGAPVSPTAAPVSIAAPAASVAPVMPAAPVTSTTPVAPVAPKSEMVSNPQNSAPVAESSV